MISVIVLFLVLSLIYQTFILYVTHVDSIKIEGITLVPVLVVNAVCLTLGVVMLVMDMGFIG